MFIRKIAQSCLCILLLGLVFQQAPASPVRSQQLVSPTVSVSQAAGQNSSTSTQGLEKLSPDLRAMLAGSAFPDQRMASDAITGDDLLVSALVKPGAQVQRFFVRSATSREIGGLQWVTGTIRLKGLAKLASTAEVLGVISTDTYQTAEAPGLEDLRTNPRGVTIQQARALLKQGGTDALREQIAREAAASTSPGASRPLVELPDKAGALNAPGLRGIHDVEPLLERGITGQGVVVGIVDTGVDFANPDLQGVQALIPSGPFAGWPFAYDVYSGALYAMNYMETIGPENYWYEIGRTLYAHTWAIHAPACDGGTCSADLMLVPGVKATRFTWPDTSKSRRYYYTVHPDFYLAIMAYNRELNYPAASLLPPVVIVSDEQEAGIYDTAYIDVNFNGSLFDAPERVTRESPLSGADLDGDGTWDLSGGMLGWISDGAHHPPGVEVLYPEVSANQPPGAGRLLVFISDPNGHGTSCASQVAGQGRMTDPNAAGPANPLFAGGINAGGVGGAVISSMAPGTTIAAFQNGFDLPFDAWTLGVLGMDGTAGSGDEVNILSNSWGNSQTIEDGWDPVSRFAQNISYTAAPGISILVATGNGGHGYGTVTAPGGGSIIDVGASTAYGALRSFELVTPEQFLYGDIQPWSNRGPGGLGDIAPDVVAVGAWGAAAVPLNLNYRDGQSAYDVFGGTSMATPVAAGSLALIYQAYHDSFGSWPAWDRARDLLLNGADDLGYEAFSQGAGNTQAGKSVEIIDGNAPLVAPAQWQAGGYRGVTYPAFPGIVFAGEQSEQTFTIQNPSGAALAARASSGVLQKIHEETFSFSYTNPPPESPVELPIFLKDLTGLVDQYDPDLLRVQVVYPYEKFDFDGDMYADTWWSAHLYDWKDRNQNGKLWIDHNHNGRVDENEMDIDPATGLMEFNRFTYGYPQGNVLEASLGRKSLSQRHDGVFLGLRCTFCGQSTNLQVRVSFYQKTSWPWLSLTLSAGSVPAHGEASLRARLAVPAGVQPGAYEGEIVLEIGEFRRTIPVVVHVAAQGGTFAFGGQAGPSTPYDNSSLFGGFNWHWRYESGDWRFFYFDIPAGTARPGSTMLVDTRWSDPRTDVDTWVMGPSLGIGSEENTAVFGPQKIQVAGGSADTYLNGGLFRWQTNTGSQRELVATAVQDGLGIIALHNVLNGGLQLAEGIEGKVFQVTTDPGSVEIRANGETGALPFVSGSRQVTLESTGDLQEGLQIQAYGMTPPVDLHEQVIFQNPPNNICASTWIYRKNEGGLAINNGAVLEVTTSAADANLDLDIFLYEDDGNGKWDCGIDSLLAYSINSGAQEKIRWRFPKDGAYWVVAHGNDVPRGISTFDIRIRAISGSDLTVENFPVGPLRANQPLQFNVNYHGIYASTTPVALEGLLFIGTPSTPDLIEVPVTMIPEILLYPAPALSARVPWLGPEPDLFTLRFENRGASSETVTAQVTLPAGVEYQQGSATGPGSAPVYDPVARALTWKVPAASGEKILLTFQAFAPAGAAPGRASMPYSVKGATSGQEWRLALDVWVNMYGQLLPFIRR